MTTKHDAHQKEDEWHKKWPKANAKGRPSIGNQISGPQATNDGVQTTHPHIRSLKKETDVCGLRLRKKARDGCMVILITISLTPACPLVVRAKRNSEPSVAHGA